MANRDARIISSCGFRYNLDGSLYYQVIAVIGDEDTPVYCRDEFPRDGIVDELWAHRFASNLASSIVKKGGRVDLSMLRTAVREDARKCAATALLLNGNG